MAYTDPMQKKDPDGIKCRLDEYDIERLDAFLERAGGQRAVVIRDAVIEFLDRAGIDYSAEHKRDELQKRRIALAVSDRIRAMSDEVQRIHGRQPAVNDLQKTLSR